jgi:hypothetical protein
MPSLNSTVPASLSRPVCLTCSVEMWLAVAPLPGTKGLDWIFRCPVCKTTVPVAQPQ